MKRTILILLSVGLLAAALGCKPKPKNENITFAATITAIEEDGLLVQTSADVGFDTALIHIGEDCKPDFNLLPGQTVQLTILPMVTRSIPPQATAVAISLIAEAPDNGVASVTEGLDPMPMLTPGADAGAEKPDTLEAHMADMHPVLDAITRTMGIEGEQGYLPEDPVFLWSVLIAMSTDWGHTSPDVTDEGTTIVVPLSVMQAWALAACGRTDALPPVPEMLADDVTFNEDKSAYICKKSDVSNDSVTALDSFFDNGDGTYAATLGFYLASGERLGGMDFQLRDAPADNGAYRYVVTNAAADR